MTTTTPIQGGCACGRVRYELRSQPFDTGYCHCRICQRISGAPALVFTTVPLEDFVVIEGRELVRAYASTTFGERQFCSACGTPLTIHVQYQADTIDVTVATLDHPEALAPGYHIYDGSRIPWFDTADTLPRHAALRPETRGL
jgi:hypothetical protein